MDSLTGNMGEKSENTTEERNLDQVSEFQKGMDCVGGEGEF